MTSGEAPEGDATADAVRRKLLFPALALIAGAAVSAGSFFIIRDNVETEAKLRFERHASDAQHVLTARIDSYADVMYGLRSLYSANYPVTRVQFHNYVKSLELARRYPGFWGFN